MKKSKLLIILFSVIFATGLITVSIKKNIKEEPKIEQKREDILGFEYDFKDDFKLEIINDKLMDTNNDVEVILNTNLKPQNLIETNGYYFITYANDKLNNNLVPINDPYGESLFETYIIADNIHYVYNFSSLLTDKNICKIDLNKLDFVNENNFIAPTYTRMDFNFPEQYIFCEIIKNDKLDIKYSQLCRFDNLVNPNENTKLEYVMNDKYVISYYKNKVSIYKYEVLSSKNELGDYLSYDVINEINVYTDDNEISYFTKINNELVCLDDSLNVINIDKKQIIEKLESPKEFVDKYISI